MSKFTIWPIQVEHSRNKSCGYACIIWMKLIHFCPCWWFSQNFCIISILSRNKFVILLNMWSMRFKSAVDIDQWKSLVSIHKFGFQPQRWWFTLQRNKSPFTLVSYSRVPYRDSRVPYRDFRVPYRDFRVPYRDSVEQFQWPNRPIQDFVTT